MTPAVVAQLRRLAFVTAFNKLSKLGIATESAHTPEIEGGGLFALLQTNLDDT
jgi:hypothetical protein